MVIIVVILGKMHNSIIIIDSDTGKGDTILYREQKLANLRSDDW